MHITPTIVIGAGQAGLALSRELSAARQPHVVLERGRIGERWRAERWDSLSLLTPNWLNVLPGADGHADPHGFLTARAFAGHLRDYARSFAAPVAERTAVLDVRRHGDRYRVRTDRGEFAARNVVVATGDCDLPRLPAAAADVPAGVRSQHASEYRSPGATCPRGSSTPRHRWGSRSPPMRRQSRRSPSAAAASTRPARACSWPRARSTSPPRGPRSRAAAA